MFGIGFGEILIILLVAFLLSPKEIPKVINTLSRLFKEISRIKNNLNDVGEDLNKLINDEKKDIIDTLDDDKKKDND